MKFFLSLLYLCVPLLLKGEIRTINLHWTKGACTPAGAEILERRLNQIPAVASANLINTCEEAQLKWKPNKPFSMNDLRTAVAWVGLGIRDIGIVVHGTITHDSKHVYLTSIGDMTKFQLLSPVEPDSMKYAPRNQRATMFLANDLREKLIEKEKKHELVVISGDLFEYYRPPLTILVKSIE